MHFWTTGTPAPVFQAVSLIDWKARPVIGAIP